MDQYSQVILQNIIQNIYLVNLINKYLFDIYKYHHQKLYNSILDKVVNATFVIKAHLDNDTYVHEEYMYINMNHCQGGFKDTWDFFPIF